MSNKVIIKNGQGTPTAEALGKAELGFDTLNEWVYVGRENNSPLCISPEIKVDLDGAVQGNASLTNADTLNGKPAHYYGQATKLTPRNLFDNSDFRNPVNQRGLTTYEAPSGAPNNIDRWYGNRATITVDGNGITLLRNTTASTSATYIGQKIKDITSLMNKTITIAFMTNLGLLLGSGTFTGAGFNYYNGGNWKISFTTATNAFVIQTTSEASIKLYWAALYEGEYTAETLPEYQPKGYENELLVCRQYDPSTGEYVGLRKFGQPRNLLDNSDFRNPVNQRGQTSYTNGYTIDRWRATNKNINVIVGDGKITLSKSNGGCSFNQPLPFDTTGKKLTLAVKTGDGLFIHTFPKSVVGELDQFPGMKAYYGISGSGINSAATIYFNNADDINLDIYWAALYEGEYTAETLPEYQPKGYSAELAECRRYYRRTWNGDMTSYGAISFVRASHGISQPVVFFDTPMRIAPTVTVHSWAGGAGNIRDWGNGTDVSGITVNYISPHGFAFDKLSDLTAGKVYAFHYEASADL